MFGKLILLFLIVVAAAFSIPKTRAMIEKEARPWVDKVKERMVPGKLNAIVKELVAQADQGVPLPQQGNAWRAWLDNEWTGGADDPWGHPYYYYEDRDGFTVGSMGPDGIRGDTDDITAHHAFRQH